MAKPGRLAAMRRPLPSLALIGTMVAMLAACSAISLAALSMRMHGSGVGEYSFLRVNLVLAWLPLAFAVGLHVGIRRQWGRLHLFVLAILWLLFLPNAPYLMTDFVHEGNTVAEVPRWLDLAMFSAFGFTGLLIGYASLYLVQTIIAARWGQAAGWALCLPIASLVTAGIYLGRVLRLNSWDAFTRPHLLTSIVATRLRDPLGNPSLIQALIAGSLLLALGYVCFVVAGSRTHNAVMRRREG